MKRDWTLTRSIKRGHRYWRCENDGAIGISDDSGAHPDACEPADRPPLLLDCGWPVAIRPQGCLVPLTNAAGEATVTPTSGFEVLWVAAQFSMEIEALERGSEVPWRFVVHRLET